MSKSRLNIFDFGDRKGYTTGEIGITLNGKEAESLEVAEMSLGDANAIVDDFIKGDEKSIKKRLKGVRLEKTAIVKSDEILSTEEPG